MLETYAFSSLGISGRPLPAQLSVLAREAVMASAPHLLPTTCWTAAASPFWINKEVLYRLKIWVTESKEPLSFQFGKATYINAVSTDQPTVFTSAFAFSNLEVVLDQEHHAFRRFHHEFLSSIRVRAKYSSPFFVTPTFARSLLGRDVPRHATIYKLPGSELEVVSASETYDANAFHIAATELELPPVFVPSFGQPPDITETLKLTRMGHQSRVWVSVADLAALQLTTAANAPVLEITLCTFTRDADFQPARLVTLPPQMFVNGDFVNERARLDILAFHQPITFRGQEHVAGRAALSLAAANASYRSRMWLPLSIVEKYGIKLKPLFYDRKGKTHETEFVTIGHVQHINADNLDATEEALNRIRRTERWLRYQSARHHESREVHLMQWKERVSLFGESLKQL